MSSAVTSFTVTSFAVTNGAIAEKVSGTFSIPPAVAIMGKGFLTPFPTSSW